MTLTGLFTSDFAAAFPSLTPSSTSSSSRLSSMLTLLSSSTTSSTPTAGKGTGQQDPTIPSVNISKWEFCEGCKVTVEAYSLASYRRMRDMQARKVLPKTN